MDFRKRKKENKENKYRHAFKAGQRLKLCGALLHILQGGEIFFAGADLDHAGHVVNKDLTIADVAGVHRRWHNFPIVSVVAKKE